MKKIFAFLLLGLCILYPGLSPTAKAEEKSKAVQSPDPAQSVEPGKNAPDTLTEIRTIKGKRQYNLIFSFAGPPPTYKQKKSSEDGWVLFTLEFQSTIIKNIEIPDLEIPLSHMEITGSIDWDVPFIKVWMYLQKIPPYNISRNKNEVRISFTIDPTPPKTAPAQMKNAAFKNPDDKTLLMKFEFDRLPEDRILFLTRKEDRMFIIFHNAVMENPDFGSLNAAFLKDHKTIHGVTNDSVPYIKLIFKSDSKLDFDVREDDYRFFVDLMSEEKILLSPESPREVLITHGSPLPQDSKAAAEAIPEKQEAGELAKTSVPEKSGDRKTSGRKWIYLSLGTGALIGGSVATAIILYDKKKTEDNRIEDIEDEVRFPQPYPE